jgi:hypothetical protein
MLILGFLPAPDPPPSSGRLFPGHPQAFNPKCADTLLIPAAEFVKTAHWLSLPDSSAMKELTWYKNMIGLRSY